jgi:hypothetical protein
MYDGDLTFNDMEQTLENNDGVNYLPTTEQDAIHLEGDKQFGRHYNEQFDRSKVGKHGTEVLNDPINDSQQPDLEHGQPHRDVIEKDLDTGHIYHNRVFDPGLDDPGL